MTALKWKKTNEDGFIWWDLVIAGKEEKGYVVGYRDDGNSWRVVRDYYTAPDITAEDSDVPKAEFPTYQKLRKHLRLEYLLTRYAGEGL